MQFDFLHVLIHLKYFQLIYYHEKVNIQKKILFKNNFLVIDILVNIQHSLNPTNLLYSQIIIP